jgi:hypothetical protein
MFSRPILATDINKTKLSWWDYWIVHCLGTGFQTIRYNFDAWMDLVWFSDNHVKYALLEDDDPYGECYREFWYRLNDDDVDPKEFLEFLMGLANDVETGKVETFPLDIKALVAEMDQLLAHTDEEN